MATEVDPQQQAHDFVMPEVQLGTAVFFYPNHVTTHPHLAWVTKIGKTGKNIVLRTAERMVYDSVKHVDDPRLDWNIDHRESGSWDFTDEWKRLEEERRLIKARLDALEHQATKSVTAKRKTKSSS